LGDRNFLSRFQNFNNHFDEILRQADGATTFDLRIDDRIITIPPTPPTTALQRKEVKK
jgi:hypothetical protein